MKITGTSRTTYTSSEYSYILLYAVVKCLPTFQMHWIRQLFLVSATGTAASTFYVSGSMSNRNQCRQQKTGSSKLFPYPLPSNHKGSVNFRKQQETHLIKQKKTQSTWLSWSLSCVTISDRLNLIHHYSVQPTSDIDISLSYYHNHCLDMTLLQY